jgi:hypothetical protein
VSYGQKEYQRPYFKVSPNLKSSLECGVADCIKLVQVEHSIPVVSKNIIQLYPKMSSVATACIGQSNPKP